MGQAANLLEKSNDKEMKVPIDLEFCWFGLYNFSYFPTSNDAFTVLWRLFFYFTFKKAALITFSFDFQLNVN